LLQDLLAEAPLYFLIFARVYALLQVSPLMSSGAIPATARVALAGFTAMAVLPMVAQLGYPIPDTALGFGMLLVGEVLTGIILGFILVLIYAAFQMAGQFFSVQMGFGASQVYDPLAQIEIPLLGQLLNMMAMFVFISIEGFQKLFLYGVLGSFQAFKAADLLYRQELISDIMIKGLSGLFEKGMIISLPILGTLMLVSITTGLMAKAAPQMNLLMIGFPISITVGFIMMIISMPFILEAFARVIDESFLIMENLMINVSGGGV